MIKQTGETYTSSRYGKSLVVSEAKVGKTCNLVGGLLGVLPWQKNGGVVTAPKHLHVIAVDANAVGGVKRFLLDTCKATKETLGFTIWNIQDDVRRISEADDDYDMSLFNTLMGVQRQIREEVAAAGQSAVAAVVYSSLTTIAGALERGVVGPPKGSGYADPNKWKIVQHQLNEIRSYGQIDFAHTLWEGHIYQPPPPPAMKKNANADDLPKEKLQISGQAGHNFPNNVEQIFRMRRQFGTKSPGTECDQVYLDTQAALAFVAGGRNFTEALNPKEYDITIAYNKLGLRIGRWGMKAAPPKATAAAK